FSPQGEKFDPNFHQAMYEAPTSDQPPGQVAQVIQAGYMIGDRVLRPALVAVSKAKAPTSANDNPGPGRQSISAQRDPLADRSETSEGLVPFLGGADANHTHKTARAEAHPLHQRHRVAGRASAICANLVAWRAADPHRLR